MDIFSFISFYSRLLEMFYLWYKEQNRLNPKLYPLDGDSIETWAERFNSYVINVAAKEAHFIKCLCIKRTKEALKND